MKMTPCSIEKVRGSYAKTKYQELLEQFIASGEDCAKVDGWTSSSAGNAATAISCAIRRFGYHHIACVTRKGDVFLLRKEALEK